MSQNYRNNNNNNISINYKYNIPIQSKHDDSKKNNIKFEWKQKKKVNNVLELI